MNCKSLLHRLSASAIVLIVAIWAGKDASAQEYGVGETVVVPKVTGGDIVVDGVIETDVWDLGASVDLLANPSWWSDDFPQDIEEATAQLLFKEDTLFIHVFVDDNTLYTDAEAWMSDQIFIGIDPDPVAGETDQLVDQDDWAGWPDNAPDAGPHAYKVYVTEDGGEVTLNFDAAAAAPYVDAVVYRDDDNQDWGVEAAIYVPTIEQGAEIGFNVGGAQANSDACEELDGECAYGFFSSWSTEYPGSDVYSRTDSYATLQIGTPETEGYGSGVVLQVPKVEPGALTMDGEADEAAWDNAQTDIDFTQEWNAYGEVGEPLGETPDLAGETKLLWSDDTLYVYHLIQDNLLFWGGDDGEPWNADALFVGLDNSHEGDSLFAVVDGEITYDGAPQNAPTGVHTYFINGPDGLTLGWRDDLSPTDSGWVNGVVFVDEDALEWGIEAAFYVPNAEMNAEIGFDIGGDQANADQCEAEGGECVYAYYAWQSGREGGGQDPGALNRSASDWATLHLVEEITTAIEALEEVPEHFALKQNYPNPFNPSTTIEFATTGAGHVQLDVFDILGRKVATLVDETHASGTYRVGWDAAGVSSGVYVYQLRIDGELVGSRKMMLIK